jgi:hypothetical protein
LPRLDDKDGATKITKDLRLRGLLPESVEFLSPSQAGYENGIGMMSAEARMAAYENGIGMMSAEARMAASKKGYENGLGKAAKREWTEEADASIIRMIKEKLSYAKIASKLGNGLSKNEVQNRWDRKLSKSSGIIKPAVQPGFPSRITWTEDADATIVRMKADGITYAEIAAELGNGLSMNDVQHRWNRHLKNTAVNVTTIVAFLYTHYTLPLSLHITFAIQPLRVNGLSHYSPGNAFLRPDNVKNRTIFLLGAVKQTSKPLCMSRSGRTISVQR